MSLTKGDNGISGVPRPALGALSLGPPLPFFYFTLAAAAAAWALLGLLVVSPFGLGLQGMRERVSLLGGTMRTESSPGAGTTILIRIPGVEPLDEPDPSAHR